MSHEGPKNHSDGDGVTNVPENTDVKKTFIEHLADVEAANKLRNEGADEPAGPTRKEELQKIVDTRLEEIKAEKAKASKTEEDLKKEITEKLGGEPSNPTHEDKPAEIQKQDLADKQPLTTETKEEKEGIPDIKLEGETIAINGKVYIIEGTGTDKDGKKTYKAKILQSVMVDEADKKNQYQEFGEETVRNAANARREEMWSDYKVRFNFTDEDIERLEKDKKFSNLSLGQRQFVLNSLTAATLEKVDEVALNKFNARHQDKSKVGRFFGKVGDSIMKHTRVTKMKTDVFKEMRDGGGERFQDDLSAIISRVGIMGVPIIENERGEVEVQYSKQFPGMFKDTPESTRAQRLYDQAATALQNIPTEWDTPTAKYMDQHKARQAKEAYEAARNKCFSFYSPSAGKKTFERFLTESTLVDSKVDLNRYMSAHPESERVLNDLYKSNDYKPVNWLGDRAHDALKRDQRGYYFAGGWIARQATTLSGVGTAALGGIVGGLRGFNRGRQKVRDEETSLRRGNTKLRKDEDGKTSEEHMYRIEEQQEGERHKGYIDKMNDIVMKMQEAAFSGNNEEAAFYKTMLDNRISHALDRAAKGKVTFGNKDVRIGNQASFVAGIARSQAFSRAVDPAMQKEWNERITKLMQNVKSRNATEDQRKRQEQKNFVKKEMLMGAALGFGLAGAGYYAREAYESLNHGGAFDINWSEPHAAADNLDANAYAPDKTYVAMPEPHATFPDDGILHNFDNHTIPEDAYVGKGEGIEHVLRKQIEHDEKLAKALGWKEGTDIHKFSGDAAHKLAIKEGYVDPKTGQEVRVKYTGEGDKRTFYEITEHSDGKIHIDEGQGTHYNENEAFDQNDRYSVTDREINHHQDYEYIHGNNEHGAINHAKLTEPENHVDKGVEYERTFTKVKAPLQEEDAVPAPKNAPANVEDGVKNNQPGKSLVQNGTEEDSRPDQGLDNGHRVGRSSVAKSSANVESHIRNEYPNDRLQYRHNQVGNQYNNQPNYEQYGNRAGYRIGKDGLPRSPRGTYMKTIRVDGKEIMYDTHSYNEVNAFDGAVNRNYNRLLEKIFPGGQEDMYGNSSVNDGIEKMLGSHMAEDDVYSSAAPGADLNTQHYYNIIHRIHEESGLEPREGQPTRAYLKEALQKLNNNDVKIRKFVTQIIKDEEKLGITKVKSIANDDVYR